MRRRNPLINNNKTKQETSPCKRSNMEKQHEKTAVRIGAYTTLIGSLCMLGGAAIWGISGADIDQAIYDKDLAGYLAAALAGQRLLIANLSIWIIGVILLGAGAAMMAFISDQRSPLATLARYNYWLAVPLVVASYMAWLAVVVQLAPSDSPAAAAIAEAMGWFAVRADWVGTALVLGSGPALLAAAGRSNWAPNWLRIWSYVALLTCFLTTLAQFTGGLTTYGFLIIPVGMGWMLAASVVLFRRMGKLG